MLKKRRAFYYFVILFISFVLTIIFMTHTLNSSDAKSKSFGLIRIYSEIVEEAIRNKLSNLPNKYNVRNLAKDNTSDNFINFINKSIVYEDISKLWKEVNLWTSQSVVYKVNSKLGAALQAMKTEKIIKADLDNRGSQLKFLFHLMENQTVVFKPKRYDKQEVIEGVVYAGKDRYGSEILAFYLSGILNIPLVPLSVERKVNFKTEILPVATENFRRTTFKENNKTCVFGSCYYCIKSDPACTDDHESMIGAVIFNINEKFKNYKNPWRRTYKKNKPAQWELDEKYCNKITKSLPEKRVLDLIDVSVFDFLIQNGDRHHYEVLNNEIVWLDNGKGLGNPHVDHIDILAPLYQCCIIRKKMWNRLKELSGGLLREKLELMPAIKNFIDSHHLQAIERRLLILYATVEYCKSRNEFIIK